jgi:hypothetical protein
VVTADGTLARADADHEPDLFWALRGGGSFGVVTALEFRLFPVTEAYAGALWYPIQRGSEVLHAWGELTRSDVPDELTTVGRFVNLPPIPQLPEQIRGKSFVLVEAYHFGDPAQADQLLGPLRAPGPVNDTITAVPLPALSHLHMDPEQPVPGKGDGMMLASLPGQAVDALAETAGPGALACLDADYMLFAVGSTPVQELAGPVTAQVEAVKHALAPWAARQMYLNFAETATPAAPLWTEQAYHRVPSAPVVSWVGSAPATLGWWRAGRGSRRARPAYLTASLARSFTPRT